MEFVPRLCLPDSIYFQVPPLSVPWFKCDCDLQTNEVPARLIHRNGRHTRRGGRQCGTVMTISCPRLDSGSGTSAPKSEAYTHHSIHLGEATCSKLVLIGVTSPFWQSSRGTLSMPQEEYKQSRA